MNFKEMLNDQREFNRQIWNPDGRTHSELMDRLRTLGVGMVEETVELLRTHDYKPHRRRNGLQNIAHSHEELIDMFKFWMSLADLTDFPFDRLEELYYAKSRVVQYRYQEEWLKTIDRPAVVVDIDNVLADYIFGICEWAKEFGPDLLSMSNSDRLRFVARLIELQTQRRWVDAESVGVPVNQWSKIKHHFRTTGGKRHLPVFDDAKPFLEWCRSKGWLILLITSRPFDRYPNLFTDTMTWLHENDIEFDYLWWADDKAMRLEEAPATTRGRIVFAVDDGPKYVAQFRSKGVKTYLLDRRPAGVIDPTTDELTIRSLYDLIGREEDATRFRTATETDTFK